MICTYRPQLSGLLGDGSSNGGALHFTLGVDNDTGVVLKVQVDSVRPPPGLALADNDGGHDLLPQLGLSLLDGRHDHVTGTTSGQAVETCTDTLNGDDVQVTGTGVVAAVHDSTATCPLVFIPYIVFSGRIAGGSRLGGAVAAGFNVHWQTKSHLELVTGGRTSTVCALATISPHDSVSRVFLAPLQPGEQHTRAFQTFWMIIGGIFGLAGFGCVVAEVVGSCVKFARWVALANEILCAWSVRLLVHPPSPVQVYAHVICSRIPVTTGTWAGG